MRSSCSSTNRERQGIRKVGREADCTGFENQSTERYHEFESHTFLMSVESEIAACKKKTRYGTQQAADKAARGRMANPNVPDLRSYKCEWCRGYHLTKNHNRDLFD